MRHPVVRTATLYFIALALCASVQALDSSLDIHQYAHTSWKVRDGFAKGMILSIAQSPDGYLWLGTEFGLVRFDGVRAVPWKPSSGQQLPSDITGALLFARDGTFWIGTINGLASLKDGKLTLHPEMAGQHIAQLIQDHEGTIWAVAHTSLVGTKICSIRNAGVECQGVEGSVGVAVGGLHEDSMQNLWVGVPNGFWRWKPGPPKFFSAVADVLGVIAFGEDEQRALLVALKNGVHRFVNGQIERHPLPYPGLASSVDKIFRDRDGGFWFGTLDHGLVHVHQGKAESFSASDGLSGDTVFSIFEDREGDVWVATSDGIDQFRSYSVPTISQRQGVSNAVIISAMAARDGRVWIASLGGLDIWDHGRVSAFRPSNRGWNSAGSTSGSVPNFPFEDSSGRIWVSAGGELGYLDHGRFVTAGGYPGGAVRALAEGARGNFWVASPESGLFELFQEKVVQHLSWRGLGLKQDILALAVDHGTEGLWLGFIQGGIAYVRESKVQALYSAAEGLGRGAVHDLRIDSRGALWAATEGGLSRIEGGHISTLTSRNGLPCDAVYWSIEDDDHAMWLYMPCGLMRISKEQLNAWEADAKTTIDVKVLDTSDGVQTPPMTAVYGGSGPLVTRSRDGKIWFTASGGVSILDPHHLLINSLPAPVHIEQIVADDKAYNPAAGLRLSSRIHYLAIDYTALSLAVPEKVRFRYRLEGVDPGWREVVNDREVQYSNLSPGHYRFRVIAANNSGVWNEQGDTVEFDILPTWYQTLLFRTVCAFAFLLFLWWAYFLRVRQLRGQEEKLRDVVETIPTFAWTALPDGSVDFVNRHWKEFTGLSTDKTVGSGWESAVHSSDLERHVEKWRASLATGEPFENEVRYRQGQDGQYRWFLARAVPLRDTRGKILKWYGISTDIEDRKRAEQERETLRSDLAHVNRVSMLGELAASLSHELKQPIAATMLNADTCISWLKREKPDLGEACETANNIRKAGRRASEIIDRLRSLYKKAPPQRELVDVNEIISEMVVMLRGEANRYAVSQRTDLAAGIPKITADRVQLQQVLMNLMLNAIEAMRETGGSVLVETRLNESGLLQISVHDTGPGLPAAKEDQIFEPFFTTKPQGSGMGLAISRSIIESHGGRLWATRNSGPGATFHFTLPIAGEARRVPAIGA